MCTFFAVPLNLVIIIQAQRVFGTCFHAVAAMVAETHRVGVMAGLALEITALEEYYQAVSGTIDA